MSEQGGMGARFAAADLDEWQAWSRRQRRTEAAIRRVRSPRSSGAEAPRGTLHLPSGQAKTLVVIDQRSPSCDAAIVEPLRHLDPHTTAVLTRAGTEVPFLPDGSRCVDYDGPGTLPLTIRSVLSLGGYLALSAPLLEWTRQHDVAYLLVQHGLLTSYSPPAPQGAQVLAWSEADAEFWSAGRPDLSTSVVGSQMLFEAARADAVTTVSDRPVMLGQLHGSELSRRDTFFAYWEFCRQVSSDYRPHPNERDAASRALHRVMQRGGITFETSGTPLPELARPVVSIFSTGTLEAATRGLPAWVYHPDPPRWVREFWRRYRLAEYGTTPTRAWPTPNIEPSREVAHALERYL